MLTTLALATLVALSGCKKDGGDDSGGGTDGGTDGGSTQASGDLLWLATGGGAADDFCASVIQATDGSLVAACGTSGFSTWGEGTGGPVDLVSEGGTDALLLGLDAVDGSVLWHLQIGSEGGDSVELAALARLDDGRIAALLELGGPVTVAGVDLGDVTAGDLVLFLVDDTGAVDRALRLAAGPAFVDVLAWSVRPAPGGGLLVSGGFVGDLTLLPGSTQEETLVASGDYDSAMIWLDADLGLEQVWRLGAQDTGDIDSVGIVAQAWPLDDGGAVVAGWFLGSMTLGQASPQTLVSKPSPDQGDAFVAVLDASGEPEWTRQVASSAEDFARSVVPTADGFVAAGYYNYGEAGDSTLAVAACDGASLAGDADHNADIFVLSLGTDGCPRWLHGISSDDVDTGVHLAAFDDGAVMLSGWANQQDVPGRSGQLRFDDGETISVDGVASVLVRYEADGSRAWTHVASESLAHGVHVLADGRVTQANAFLSGAVYGSGQSDPVTPLSAGSFDGLVGLFAP